MPFKGEGPNEYRPKIMTQKSIELSDQNIRDTNQYSTQQCGLRFPSGLVLCQGEAMEAWTRLKEHVWFLA
jgi:hypothetical protein